MKTWADWFVDWLRVCRDYRVEILHMCTDDSNPSLLHPHPQSIPLKHDNGAKGDTPSPRLVIFSIIWRRPPLHSDRMNEPYVWCQLALSPLYTSPSRPQWMSAADLISIPRWLLGPRVRAASFSLMVLRRLSPLYVVLNMTMLLSAMLSGPRVCSLSRMRVTKEASRWRLRSRVEYIRKSPIEYFSYVGVHRRALTETIRQLCRTTFLIAVTLKTLNIVCPLLMMIKRG